MSGLGYEHYVSAREWSTSRYDYTMWNKYYPVLHIGGPQVLELQ
jgi:hypothetical protein